MNNIYKVEDLVRYILTNYPETRNDDFLLIAQVYNKINPNIINRPFSEVMLGHKELKLPYFETIRRTRQKIQAKDESLRASKKVEDARTNRIADYIDYAIDGKRRSFMKLVDNME